MGAYAYCAGCRQSMAVPTPTEALLDLHACSCGVSRPVEPETKRWVLDELLERLGRLENFARAGVPLPPPEE